MKILTSFLFIILSVLIGCGQMSTSEPPTITITSPKDGAIILGKCGINFDIEAVVYDDVDELFLFTLYIKKVGAADYSTIGSSVSTELYCSTDGSSFDTTTYENGQYYLKITAEDSHGKIGEAEIKINISN